MTHKQTNKQKHIEIHKIRKIDKLAKNQENRKKREINKDETHQLKN